MIRHTSHSVYGAEEADDLMQIEDGNPPPRSCILIGNSILVMCSIAVTSASALLWYQLSARI